MPHARIINTEFKSKEDWELYQQSRGRNSLQITCHTRSVGTSFEQVKSQR